MTIPNGVFFSGAGDTREGMVAAGDINGDRFDDIIVGDPCQSANDQQWSLYIHLLWKSLPCNLRQALTGFIQAPDGVTLVTTDRHNIWEGLKLGGALGIVKGIVGSTDDLLVGMTDI